MEPTANIVAILAGVFATIVTSVVTYMATRASIRNEDKRLDLDSKRTDRDFATLDIEQAERLGAVSMNLINSMQSQYGDCIQRNAELDTKLTESKKRVTTLERAIANMISAIRDVFFSHIDLAEDKECPGFCVVQEKLTTIINEAEASLQS